LGVVAPGEKKKKELTELQNPFQLKKTILKTCNTSELPTSLYERETWEMKEQDKSRI